MYVLNANQIREVENRCFNNYCNETELMLKAGTACFKAIKERYSASLKNASVSVLCGNGKNAGDGFVIARLLYSYGANAKIILCDKNPYIDEPVMYFDQAVKSGVAVEKFTKDSVNADFIVDSMFGIGFHGEPRAPFDSVFKIVAQSNAKVIAIDTPSGSDATSGKICSNCVKADFTIAISTLKYAHILPPSNSYCGETVVVDIGIPCDCYNEKEYVKTIDFKDVKSSFIKRDKNSNKGTFGRQLNLCGSYKMPGAAVISTKAAVRSGAGLVKLTVPESAYPLAAAHLVQPIFNPVEENEDGTYSACAIKTILQDVKWADSIVIGCGIGCNDDTDVVVRSVLKNSDSPIIIDADGINCINSRIDILKEIKVPVVLTPHPGEMARCVSKQVAQIQENRIEIAKEFANEYGIVLVLKGANTVVTDGKEVFVNTTGNPSMAMGGTGDMLSGMIGAFVAQGISPLQSAKAAVFIHGRCGDETAGRLSQRGMTVLDMIEQLGTLMSDFE